MSDIWNVCTLSECLLKVIDYRGKTPKKLGCEWTKSGYKAISANNVKFNGLVKIDSINFADQNLYDKWMKEEVENGDLLLTSEAPAGQIMLWDSEEKIILSQRVFALRTNNLIYNKYLKYYIQSEIGQKEILRNNSGSTVAGISAKTFSNILVRYPTKVIQQLIGDLLYRIDKKIEINNQINTELESMAKTLYDYWFVQFDFPDENGKPYKSSGGKMVYNSVLKREIPYGWNDSQIGKIENKIITGKTPPKGNSDYFSGDVPFITIGDIRGNTFIVNTEETLSREGADFQKSKYLPEDTICVTCIATPGLVGLTTTLSQTNQQINSIICSKEYHKYFLYFALKSYFNANSKVKIGNTFANINKRDFSEIKIIYPSESLLINFHKKVSSIFEKIKSNTKESRKISELRDFLLPMLMNGQVTIKE